MNSSKTINNCDFVHDLASDLYRINLSKLEKHFESLSNVKDREKLYFHLIDKCSILGLYHPEWSLLAGRIKLHLLRQTVPKTFSESAVALKPILHSEYYQFVQRNAKKLNAMIHSERDMKMNIFAIGTLYKSYLARIKKDGKTFIYETPQYMYLRVATYLWYAKKGESNELALKKIKKVYDGLSNGDFSHASPTLFNAGLARPQLASCFTMSVFDNMPSIYTSWAWTAVISMLSGGVGIDVNSLRHSEIGQYGESGGVVPWIKIYDQILRTVDQGGKRKGSGCMYIEPWHIDIQEYLDLKKKTGKEELRARNLFYALWIPDEFMRRVESNAEWTLFCPNKVKSLDGKWGADFEMAYSACEEKAREGKISHFRIVKAREIWQKIIATQVETGMPFILYKDAINRKSNQRNLGTIRLSNLCTEITLYTDKENVGTCNLAAVALNSCVTPEGKYDYKKLEQITRTLVRNLEQVVDRSYYPEDVPQIRFSNLKNRPLGIGVHGLADVFALMDLPWTSPEAKKLNEHIFETMYYAGISESIEIAKEKGHYETFPGSPASKGLFQFDLWNLENIEKGFENKMELSKEFLSKYIKSEEKDARYDWEELRARMLVYGLRHSLLFALMPTASTANIIGNSACIEPYTKLIYTASVLSGQYLKINKHLVRDLEAIDLWNEETADNIITNDGSLAGLEILDKEPTASYKLRSTRLIFLQEKYKTIYELSQRLLLDFTLDRGKYICQSESHNCWLKNANFAKLNAYHFYGWKKGIKTGMYYLRQPAVVSPINFALEKKKEERSHSVPALPRIECTDDVCLACQS